MPPSNLAFVAPLKNLFGAETKSALPAKVGITKTIQFLQLGCSVIKSSVKKYDRQYSFMHHLNKKPQVCCMFRCFQSWFILEYYSCCAGFKQLANSLKNGRVNKQQCGNHGD